MRCISKFWNDLLSQPSFVKSHLNHSIRNTDGILLIFFDSFSFDSKPFTTHLSRSPNLKYPNFIKLPVHLRSENGCGKMIGSVNGLICFKYRSYHELIYIWNPSLSALLTLPPYSIPIPSRNSHCFELIHVNFRFAFDPTSDDYKVVKLIQAKNEWMQVEIYSMRKGSWKIIAQNIPLHITLLYNHDNICADGHAGHLHWLAATSFQYRVDTILTFDLCAETFLEIPLPDSVTDHIIDDDIVSRIDIHLGFLAGKLCVITSAQYHKCEVWVMDECGVGESWVKHDIIPRFCGEVDVNPFGFTSHNEFLFRIYPHGLALYDPVATKTKFFKFRMDYLTTECKVVEYVDSLVWVTPEVQSEMNCFSNSQTSIWKGFLRTFWSIWVDSCRVWILMMFFVGWFWVLVKGE